MIERTEKLDNGYSFTNEDYGYIFCPAFKHYKHKRVCEACKHAETCKSLSGSKLWGKYMEFRTALKVMTGCTCSVCGKTVDPICFHHLDENTKKFEIAGGYTRTIDKLWAELDKCIALCQSCHRKLHGGGQCAVHT